MRTRSPARNPARSNNPCHAVRAPIGTDAASAWLRRWGFGAMLDNCATQYSAVAPSANQSFRPKTPRQTWSGSTSGPTASTCRRIHDRESRRSSSRRTVCVLYLQLLGVTLGLPIHSRQRAPSTRSDGQTMTSFLIILLEFPSIFIRSANEDLLNDLPANDICSIPLTPPPSLPLLPLSPPPLPLPLAVSSPVPSFPCSFPPCLSPSCYLPPPPLY